MKKRGDQSICEKRRPRSDCAHARSLIWAFVVRLQNLFVGFIGRTRGPTLIDSADVPADFCFHCWYLHVTMSYITQREANAYADCEG